VSFLFGDDEPDFEPFGFGPSSVEDAEEILVRADRLDKAVERHCAAQMKANPPPHDRWIYVWSKDRGDSYIMRFDRRSASGESIFRGGADGEAELHLSEIRTWRYEWCGQRADDESTWGHPDRWRR
jgi:hypothetical protein